MEDNKIYSGTVIWFNSKTGYGFISWEIDGVKQKDLFAHFSDIACDGYKTLLKDQKVSFSIGTNKRDQPKAVSIIVIS